MIKVVIFMEQHDDRVFVAKSQEDIGKICLKILEERYQRGYYQVLPKPEPFVEFDLSNLSSPMLAAYRRVKKKYERDLSAHEESVSFFADCKKAIENRDGDAAKWLLDIRSEYGYEDFKIVVAEKL